MGKGEIARICHFRQILFQIRSPPGEHSAILSNSKLSSAKSFSLEQSKILSFGKGFKKKSVNYGSITL